MAINRCRFDSQPRVIDIWLEAWSWYLTREHGRLNRGPVSQHYLRCFYAYYSEFLSSGAEEDRSRTWLAVEINCQWLCQPQGTN
jgi:hypothetical protein